MNINKISFGTLITKATPKQLNDVLYNYVETDKVENEHQYTLSTISKIEASPKTEEEIFLNLLNQGIKVVKTNSKPLSFGSLEVTLKDDEENTILKNILRDYDKLAAGVTPKLEGEYKILSKGNSKLIFAIPSTEKEIQAKIDDSGINVKHLIASSFKKTEKNEDKNSQNDLGDNKQELYGANFID